MKYTYTHTYLYIYNKLLDRCIEKLLAAVILLSSRNELFCFDTLPPVWFV